jgi:type II secretion system protein N
VRFDGLTLRAGGEPIVFERLTAHPALLDLARGRLDATVQGAVLDGTFSLRLRSKTLDNPERIDVELGIDSLDAGQAPKLADIFQGEVAGRVSGEADLSVSTRNLPASSGVVSLQVVNGSAPVSSRYFRPNRLVDAMVEAQARLEQGVVMLEQGVFAAEGLRGGVTGELKLAEKMGNSLADLRGTWTIDPTLVDLEAIPLEGVVQRIRQRKELDLTITGRLEKLTIKPF